MERRELLDVAGGAAIRETIIRSIKLALFLLAAVFHGHAQGPRPADHDPELSRRIKQLASENRWPVIAQELETVSGKNADLEFYYGSALAQSGRFDDARQAFLAGRRLAPGDKRFPVELAGVAFQQKDYRGASAWMRRALHIDAADEYANDFLGTIYFLEDNPEAALKYWNRVGKPYIERVQADHPLRVRPALLDRALAFSPASEMRLADFETSRVRLEGLEIFPAAHVQLAATPEGKFDAILNLQERNGWGSNVWEALISTFSGIAYQTIYPAYDNIDGDALNVASLLRWDAQKRRAVVTLSAPLRNNPKWRYRVGVDLRNENWNIRSSFVGPAPLLGALNLRREAGGARIDSFNSGRWGWTAGAEFSHRDYPSVVTGSALSPQLLLSGLQLKQTTQICYTLLRTPEHRLTVNTEASFQVARIWSRPARAFVKPQGAIDTKWLPETRGDDYFVQSRIRAGDTSGQLPFDELYMLGMERDNDLWMRAHVGTRDGRKGSAPLGRRYFLANHEVDKNVYSNGLLTVKLSPFVDTGKITDPSGTLGARTWLWDTGVQTKVRVLGVGVSFVYGKDLRTGNNAYYFTAGRQSGPTRNGSGLGD
jgi:tetratricopeptide (TPR) repeat protein